MPPEGMVVMRSIHMYCRGLSQEAIQKLLTAHKIASFTWPKALEQNKVPGSLILTMDVGECKMKTQYHTTSTMYCIYNMKIQ